MERPEDMKELKYQEFPREEIEERIQIGEQEISQLRMELNEVKARR